MNPLSPLSRLLAAPMRPGRVCWIGVRPARREPLVAQAAALDPETGLAGDRYSSRTNRARQVTLIGAEDLAAIASYLGRETVGPELLRRNVVVSGINLLALKGQRIRLGSAVLEVTGECQPCSRMEVILGIGGYNAVRGHGGITARILAGGEARVGDRVARAE
ncbi:MOSC domain-containing protein [Roseomonas sp. E05]|uniref:MOSC domain-containing protein n=1 Tax=Roseomonas sp. E05 TaxID=3046310 RepID=UPI0024BB3963|nr:MOSC domain-containing protein [Roseomonas sp. E05]MDJ0388086.1 MOSC domain-containing protein [Roseomonas sp. E05]